MKSSSLEGQTLGKYRVLEPLGRGGMARVYRAYHPQLDRYVAIKVMRPDLADDEEFTLRFQREARAVAALRHDNIVRVHDFDAEEDLYYMVMEQLEGDTLKNRINDHRVSEKQLAWGEIVRILLDILDGLAYAHSEGMIHRDIKPANILLTKRGKAVIADFGIAHIIGGTRHTAAGALMGTLEYMAPEQGLEGRCDARSDIYSLGIVFYEMLTQNTPFDADTPLAVLMKHLNDPLPLPRKLNPDIPTAFERIVLKSLSKQPEDRYQSALEMAAALRQAAAEAEVELPTRVSLPLTFSTTEAPSESVAVFSGNTRRMLKDAEFADDETDITLRDQVSSTPQQLPPRLKRKAARKAARQAARQAKKAARPPQNNRLVTQAILMAIAYCALGNLIAITIAAFTGLWSIWEFGWPMEFFLLSSGLGLLTITSGKIWLLLPTVLIFGNGLIFAYTSITGNWSHWAFLWILEIWLVGGSLLFIFWTVKKRKSQTAKIAQSLGLILTPCAVALSSITPILAVISGIIRRLFGN